MTDPTVKELLKLINEQVRQNAVNQLKFAAEVSISLNKQDKAIEKINHYLRSDKDTNQKGIVEQVEINKTDISVMKTNDKVEKAKKTLIGVVVGSILTFIAKAFF